MESRIHTSQIAKLMEAKDRLGNPKPFSFQYAKKTGELETYQNATLSSIHSKGATVNIIVPLSPKGGQEKPHTFRKILFTRINEYKIYI